jgi:hypothetical protein
MILPSDTYCLNRRRVFPLALLCRCSKQLAGSTQAVGIPTARISARKLKIPGFHFVNST